MEKQTRKVGRPCEDLRRTAPSQESLWVNPGPWREEALEPCPCFWTLIWRCRQHDPNIISDLIENGDFSQSRLGIGAWEHIADIAVVWSMQPNQVTCKWDASVVCHSLLNFKSSHPHICLLTNQWREQQHPCSIHCFNWLNTSSSRRLKLC